MTPTQLSLMAGRGAAVCLIVRGVAAAAGTTAGALLLRSPLWAREPVFLSTLIFGLLPVVTGVVLWQTAPWLGSQVFRGRAVDEPADAADLYRVVAVFAGLLLVGFAIPQAPMLAARWIGVLGAADAAADRTSRWLMRTDTIAGTVGMVIQLSIGALLLARPSSLERLRPQDATRESTSCPTRG
jgi:hypothetical protein